MIQNTVPPMEMVLGKVTVWWCSHDQTTLSTRPNSDQTTTRRHAGHGLSLSSIFICWYGLSAPTISLTLYCNCLGSSFAVLSLESTNLVYCEPILYAIAFSTTDISIESFFLHPSDYPRQRFLSTATVWDHPLQFFPWSLPIWSIVSPSFMP